MNDYSCQQCSSKEVFINDDTTRELRCCECGHLIKIVPQRELSKVYKFMEEFNN